MHLCKVVYSISMEEKKKELSLPVAIVLGALIIAIALFAVKSPKTDRPTTENTDLVELILSTKGELAVIPIQEDDHVRGTHNADITVFEYSDLECPYCKVFHETMRRIISEYGSKVNWVYRHLPLDALHAKARTEALASECAYEQGGNDAFWGFIDHIFEITPANDGLPHTELLNTAELLKLDTNRFSSCLTEKTFSTKISIHERNAADMGGKGTPFSVILDNRTGKTYRIEGAYPYEAVKGTLDELLY